MKTLGVAEVLAWSAVAVLLALNTGPIITFTLGALYGDPAAAPDFVLQNLIYVSPVFPLILGVLAVVRLKLGGDTVMPKMGWSGTTLAKDLLIGTTTGLICIAVAVMSLQIAARYVEVPPMHLLPAPVHIFFMTLGALVPGICEELYFRGMLMRIGNRLPVATIIVLSAIAFSAWHIGTPAYLPHTFLLGLIFGTLAAVFGRLAPSMIAHTVANAGMGVLLLSGFDIGGR